MESKDYNEVTSVTAEERRAAWRAFFANNKRHVFAGVFGMPFLYYLLWEPAFPITSLFGIIGISCGLVIAATMEFSKFYKLKCPKYYVMLPYKLYKVSKHPLFPHYWKYLIGIAGIFFYAILIGLMLYISFILMTYKS